MVLRKKRQVNLLRANFAKWIKEGKVNVDDIDKVDFEAEIDSTLQYQENKDLLMSKYGYTDTPTEEEFELAEREHIHAIENFEEQEFKKSIVELKGGEQDKYFATLRSKVEQVAFGFSNSLIVEGTGGIGKTYEVLKTLGKMLKSEEYETLSGYSTPLSFYNKLYENNGKVLVLDDFEGLLSSNVAVSILKSALWSATSKRMVCYNSTSDKLNVPSMFEYTGRIVFCVNKFGTNTDLDALKTRALYHLVNFSLKDIKSIIMGIAKSGNNKFGLSGDECEVVANYIVQKGTEATRELNLRTLIKAYGAYAYSMQESKNWKKEVDELLDIDDEKQLIIDLLEKYSTKKEAKKEWCDDTGNSASTWARRLKEMGIARKYKS